MTDEKLTVFGKSFWDLWLQKIFRNLASVKYQWLVFLYVPTIYGMFTIREGTVPPEPWISAALGLGFLGGGFITLAGSRMIVKSKLTENGNGNGGLDTDS